MTSLLLLALPVLARACSYVEIPLNNSKDYIIARSMELGDIDDVITYNIAAVPRGKANHSDVHSKGTYGYVVVDSVFLGTINIPFEGMNERGLTVSALEFRQGVYQAPKAGMESLDLYNIVAVLLSNCDGVNASLAFLGKVRVVASDVPSGHNIGTFAVGLHWAITDATGRSVVVEYLKGELIVYENTPRVLTNDPDLDWQWRNLNTYVNLRPNFPHQNDFLEVQTSVGKVPQAVGHGWNLFGLPGDSSPPSRFVNLFYLREYAVAAREFRAPIESRAEAVVLGTDILDRVTIPYGTVAENDAELFTDALEYTPYSLLKFPSTRQYYIRAHTNSQWRLINLSKLDWTKPRSWPLEDGTLGIQDITNPTPTPVPPTPAPHSAKCKDHSGCDALSGNCCPADDGTMLNCCFSAAVFQV